MRIIFSSTDKSFAQIIYLSCTFARYFSANISKDLWFLYPEDFTSIGHSFLFLTKRNTKSANVFRSFLTKSANVFRSFLTKSANVQYLISLRHAKSLHRNADFLHIQNFQSIPQNAAANNATGDFNKHFIYSKLWSHTCTASAQSSPQACRPHHKRELALCNNISCLSCRLCWCKKRSFS